MWASNTNKIVYKIPAFDGGLNTKYTDVNIPFNQSPDLQNVMFDDYGAVRGSCDYTLLVSSASTSSFDSIGKYTDASSNKNLLVGYKGSIYTIASGAVTYTVIPSALSVYSIGTYGAWIKYGFEQIENHVWITQPNVTPHKWDGTKWSTVGVSNISGGLATAVCGAAGLPNGTYRYWISGVNSAGIEGDYASAISGSLVVASAQVVLTLPTWPTSWGVDSVNIYRNTAGVAAVPYLVGQTSVTASTWTDNVADTSLTVEPPTDNGRPPNLKYVVYYRARAFGFGNTSFPYRLYYSEIGSPEIWPSDNWIEVGEGDGDPISGIAILANSIVIHKNNGQSAGCIYMLFMPDSTDVTDASNWYLQRTSSAYGAVSHKSICFYNNMMFFFNKFGAFAFNGSDIALSAADSQFGKFAVESLSFEIEPNIKALPTAYLQFAEAVNHDNKIWLTVVENATTKKKVTYVYDYLQATDPGRTKGSWTKLNDISIHSMVEQDFTLYGTYGLDKTWVLKLNQTLAASATLNPFIDSYFTTKKISGYDEHRDLTKVWRAVNILVDLSGNWNLEVYSSSDLNETAGNLENVSLYYDSSKWGTMVWGTDLWSAATKDREWKRIILKQIVSETLQLKFRVVNSSGATAKTFKIYEMTIEYNLRGKR